MDMEHHVAELLILLVGLLVVCVQVRVVFYVQVQVLKVEVHLRVLLEFQEESALLVKQLLQLIQLIMLVVVCLGLLTLASVLTM